jgi:hypothetical protein
MIKPVTLAVVRSGILSPDFLQEVSRWGLPIEFVQVEEKDILKNAEDVIAHIREALESDDQIRVRDTDLDILQQYLSGQRQGRLFVKAELESGEFPTSYCVTKMGEYAIAWRSESIFEVMTDPDTYLKITEDGRTKKIGFSDVRELFFGEHKAFMVCTPQERTNGSA